MNILIVEDNPDVLWLLENVTCMLDHHVRACNSAESALIAYQKELYPLVLIDFGLPGMNGLELCRRIRMLPKGKDCFIMLITGLIPPEDLHLVLNAGADDYLTKPIDINLLKIRLEIAERQIRDRLERMKAENKLQKNRQLLETVVRNVGVILWAVDMNGTITFAEGKGSQILHLNPHDMVGQSVFGMYERYPEFLEFINRSLAGEALTVTVEGLGRILESRSTPLKNYEGEMAGIIGVSIDITAHKRAEEALQQSEANMKAILNNNVQAFILVDRQHRILAFNRLAYENNLLLKGKHIKVGESLLSYLVDEQQERLAQYLECVFRGEPVRLESSYCDNDGQERWREVHFNPAFTETGDVIGACIGFSDITERKLAETRLQKAKEAAEDSNEAKREFLTDLSHEFRTPLNGILGYAQILKRAENLTKDQQGIIDVIRSSGEYLLTMLSDILDLSKIEARRIELMRSEIDLAQFLKTLVEIVKIRIQSKPVSLSCEFQSSLPKTIYADENRLRQILLNLLINAVKFTKQGHVTLRVTYANQKSFLAPQETEGKTRLRFEVEDTGVGIPPEQQKTIFLPFRRIKDQQIQADGSGLGLAISQRLVRVMGSKLHVKSTLGKGSIFWFTLDVLETKKQARKTLETGINTYRITGIKGKTKKILIADDKDINRVLLKGMLLTLGFEILEAVDGRDALCKIEEFQPDAVLMDVVMPEMDGLEATHYLRKKPEWDDLVIIAVSASVYNRTLQESLDAGCNDFITKPIYRDDLLRVLQTHLELEWDYDDNLNIQTFIHHEDPSPPSVPSADILHYLHEAVVIGDVTSIQNQLTQLEAFDPKLQPFVSKLWHLIRNFELDEIQQYIELILKKK